MDKTKFRRNKLNFKIQIESAAQRDLAAYTYFSDTLLIDEISTIAAVCPSTLFQIASFILTGTNWARGAYFSARRTRAPTEEKRKANIHSRVHSHFDRTARKDSAASRMHVRKLGLTACMHAWWIVCADCYCRKWQDTKLWPLPSSEFHSSIPRFLHTAFPHASFSVSFVLYTSLSSSSIALAAAAYCYIPEIARISCGFFRFRFPVSSAVFHL